MSDELSNYIEPDLISSVLEQVKEQGISVENICRQFESFMQGIPFIKLFKPVSLNDGITVIDKNQFDKYLNLYSSAAKAGRLSKFVPASGAATRMFQKLQAVNNGTKITDKFNANDENIKAVKEFLNNLNKFAFYEELKKSLGDKYTELNFDSSWDNSELVLNRVLSSPGLNYATYPKGLILFHKYPGYSRTPFEEHISEALNYTLDGSGKARIHYTISEEHSDLFSNYFEKVRKRYEINDNQMNISYSFQKKSTNTIAVDLNNKPIWENDKLVFRPGGHGALLQNLNDLNGDIIFVKNIDNVVPDHLKEQTYLYKKLLAGYLIYLQNKIFEYLKIITSENLSESLIKEIENFIIENFGASSLYISRKQNVEERTNYLVNKLNRPLRVCGMVKTDEHSGGGPFWVKDNNGNISLQIVEISQINQEDSKQKEILNLSYYFNPVDLVCGVKDYLGNKFDLNKYVNPNAGFVTIKSKNGKKLKALELPGLWNGSMAYWNTIFIEVPRITFNPVKEINDLLLPEHQPVI
jgi:hypothetical protein